jgi:spore coat protein U-like protein
MLRTSRKALLLASFGFLGIFVLSPPLNPAVAATASTTFAVTATVQATCVITATALAFGTYTGVQVDATSTVTATCTNSTPYNIGLGVGGSSGASVTTRKMTGTGGALLAYSLSQDSGRAVNWGNTPGTDTVARIGNGSAQPVTVFGRMATGQLVAPGAYTDTITATVNF